MSHTDQTILSNPNTVKAQPPQKPGKNQFLIIDGLGAALLLCLALLIGGCSLLAGEQPGEPAAEIPDQPEPTATIAPTATPTPTAEPTETVSAETPDDIEPTVEPAEPAGPPMIDNITFALGATEDYEPIEPGDSFVGEVTEIHAIFEYSGLSPNYTWERVWYFNDEELSRSAEPWLGTEAGKFDYFINTGGGPLAFGEWSLELFVEGELLASGNFTLESEEAKATVQAAATATAEAALNPTETPTPTVAPAAAAPATPVVQTYKLVYTKYEAQHNMYINDTDGSSEQFIMHSAAGPSWAPGGNRIFFFGEPGANVQDRGAFPDIGNCELPGISDGIVAIDIPSPPTDVCITLGGVQQEPGWNDGTARWANVSPDGRIVAYDARPGGEYRIFFLETEQNQQLPFQILGEQADWSPDSQKIVYRSGRDGKTGIWISNWDDSGHTLVTNANDSFPAWSPDGETIAFARDEGGNVDIYTVNVDGTNLQRLTDTPGPDTLPVYTPDGQIIFRSARSGSWGIWKMNGDGSNPTEIISNAPVGDDWAYSKMSVLR